MKKSILFIATCISLTALFSSCFSYQGNNVSVTINDDEDQYTLSATFQERKTRAVQNYINEYAGGATIIKSGRADATVTLDDETAFYIRSKRGKLKIKFDKEENSAAAYEKVKAMCEGIKEIVAEN